ncbi:TetR/AcrR family transcriptional regulator [Priestia filamentosa]|uniref:TetR/AcrR family transcriptional regulator n=1 Tax=Priestia filamentosa TaxID=1402861 RepID=UPI003857266B
MSKSISPRKQKALITKSKIYKTAIELIRTKGYNHVTIDEICDKSGVTKGAFYHHFNSKESILQSSYLDADARILNKLPTIMKNRSSLEQVKEITLIYAEVVQYKGVEIIKQNMRNHLDSTKKKDDFYNDFYGPQRRPVIEIQLAILKTGQKNNEIRNDIPPENIMRYIISTFNGFVLDWCYHNGNYDFKQKMQEVWPQLIASFKE